ncbi:MULTISPECIES: hypothetical protein [Streptomyces]|uniref:Uncharacterized protein n=1 Tax=Streptomyces galilaeus TaxID=33899 RepID=A0ABW9IKZ4_STRGJ
MTDESSSRSTTATKHPHTWVVAAQIIVEGAVARVADFRGSFKTKVEQRIDALDTYCKNCRRPFADVSALACDALVDNWHLIGGDQSVRAKQAGSHASPGSKARQGRHLQPLRAQGVRRWRLPPAHVGPGRRRRDVNQEAFLASAG